MLLKEIGDLSNTYPFKIIKIDYTDERELSEGVITFSSEKNKYVVSISLYEWNMDSFYEVNFKTGHTNAKYTDLTNEQIAIKVITTVAYITKYLIQNYHFRPVEIKIKGTPKNDHIGFNIQNQRDRIYKYIAQKNINDIPGYKLQSDTVFGGFSLIPIHQKVLSEKTIVSPFSKYAQSLESKGFEAEFNPVDKNLVTIEIIGIPKKLQGQGYGSKIMNRLCNMADENNTTLQLRPSASSTHSRTKLINFYSKFGFVENKGNNQRPEFQYMYRLPKSILSLTESKILQHNSQYLYHVTNISNLEPITRYGLLPTFGDTIKIAYGDQYDFDKTEDDDEKQQLEYEGILFFSEQPSLGYSNYGKKFNFEEVLVCIIKKNPSVFKKKTDWPEFTNYKNQRVETIDHIDVQNLPIFIEKGDWFSFEEQQPIQLLYGDTLKEFLRKNNIHSNHLSESLLLEKNSTYKYGCVMLNTSHEPIKQFQQKIDPKDLYEEKDNDKFGLEKESHITLLYGLEKEVMFDDVKTIIDTFTFPKEIKINKISLFDTDDRYDVLKCDVSLPLLNKINKQLRALPYKNDYPDYHAHLTIAYLKKGLGEKYVKLLGGDVDIKCNAENVTYSTPSGKKYNISIKKELIEIKIRPITQYHSDWELKKDLKFIEKYKSFEIYNDPGLNFNNTKYFYLIQKGKINVIFGIVSKPFENYNFPSLTYIEVNPEFKNLNYGMEVYNFLIQKYGGLFSDFNQSIHGKKAWEKLFNIFPIYSYNITSNKLKKILNQKQLTFVYHDQYEEKVLLALNK